LLGSDETYIVDVAVEVFLELLLSPLDVSEPSELLFFRQLRSV